MRILALEPYYGGSHRAFLDGWCERSRHQWTVLHLPPYKWKWRMRHAAISFAEQVAERIRQGQKWDLIFCSDMLNLAEFLGLGGVQICRLPAVAYFHENQLTYPSRFESERDYHFVMTNMTTALAAKSVWFNSAFHRDSFLQALMGFLRKMPDFQPMDAVEEIREKSKVLSPAIEQIKRAGPREAGPLRILWAARWEHDKGAGDFFAALKILRGKGVDFRLSVIGEQFRQMPEVFKGAEKDFAEHIDHWGYLGRGEYERLLTVADVIVSTAEHEFFGISVVEAIAAGVYPVLPKRLAYPEILKLGQVEGSEEFFYDGSTKTLAGKLASLAGHLRSGSLWGKRPERAVKLVERFTWGELLPVLDEQIEKAASCSGLGG